MVCAFRWPLEGRVALRIEGQTVDMPRGAQVQAAFHPGHGPLETISGLSEQPLILRLFKNWCGIGDWVCCHGFRVIVVLQRGLEDRDGVGRAVGIVIPALDRPRRRC